ncbi:MAG: hypothetical protein A2284_14950 [Deltaproteobacteria bacterium RIFOXYA12_FULL_61_11]|nr:MAG: hypothetical protein A2284_14950 [Deltaproteobacteria bacterium RIFOXYA12_FULL_61_11]
MLEATILPGMLVVDDHDFNLDLFRRVFRRRFSLCTCATLEEARKALRSRPWIVLVVDAGLPDGDGLGFLLEEVPVIEGRPLRVLVSGDTCNTEQYRQAATRGIDLFLPKPFDFSELRAFLEQRLGETQPE